VVIHVVKVEMVRKLAWNVRQWLNGLGQGRTVFYGFILLGVNDRESGNIHYDPDLGHRLLVVCNRTEWNEEIILKMFNVKFTIFTTDHIKGVADLRNGVVLDFSEELGIEQRVKDGLVPRH